MLSMPATISFTVLFRVLMLVPATYAPFSQWAVQLCTVLAADAFNVYIPLKCHAWNDSIISTMYLIFNSARFWGLSVLGCGTALLNRLPNDVSIAGKSLWERHIPDSNEVSFARLYRLTDLGIGNKHLASHCFRIWRCVKRFEISKGTLFYLATFGGHFLSARLSC
jgi:hypothetical protein